MAADIGAGVFGPAAGRLRERPAPYTLGEAIKDGFREISSKLARSVNGFFGWAAPEDAARAEEFASFNPWAAGPRQIGGLGNMMGSPQVQRLEPGPGSPPRHPLFSTPVAPPPSPVPLLAPRSPEPMPVLQPRPIQVAGGLNRMVSPPETFAFRHPEDITGFAMTAQKPPVVQPGVAKGAMLAPLDEVLGNYLRDRAGGTEGMHVYDMAARDRKLEFELKLGLDLARLARSSARRASTKRATVPRPAVDLWSTGPPRGFFLGGVVASPPLPPPPEKKARKANQGSRMLLTAGNDSDDVVEVLPKPKPVKPAASEVLEESEVEVVEAAPKSQGQDLSQISGAPKPATKAAPKQQVKQVPKEEVNKATEEVAKAFMPKAKEAVAEEVKKEDAEEPGEEVTKVETTEDFWRVQVEAVYRRRNPHKLSDVPSLLEKHKGKEKILYIKVCKRYDLNPLKLYADPKEWESEDKDMKDDDDEAEPASTSAPAPSLLSAGAPSVPSLFLSGTAGSGGSLFAASTGAGNIFGASTGNIFGASTGDSIFGETKAPASSGGALWATPGASTTGNIFGASTGDSIFGETKAPANSGGALWATPGASTTGSLFGAPAASGSSGSLFGASAASESGPGALFGASTTSSGIGNLFSTPASTGSLFGAPAASGGSEAPGPLFGAPTTGSLFGTPANSSSSGSLFGASTSSSGTGSIFGTSTASAGNSLFAESAGGSLFGATTSTTAGSLFGAPAASAGSGGSIFSIPPAPSDPDTKINIFGGATQAEKRFASASGDASSGSLFGSGGEAGSSIFAAAPSSGGFFGVPAEGASSGGLFASFPAKSPPTEEKPLDLFGDGQKTPKHQGSKAATNFGSLFGDPPAVGSSKGSAATSGGDLFGFGAGSGGGSGLFGAPPPADSGFGRQVSAADEIFGLQPEEPKSKRLATDVDEEEEQTSRPGVRRKADADVLAKRKIVRARRSSATKKEEPELVPKAEFPPPPAPLLGNLFAASPPGVEGLFPGLPGPPPVQAAMPAPEAPKGSANEPNEPASSNPFAGLAASAASAPEDTKNAPAPEETGAGKNAVSSIFASGNIFGGGGSNPFATGASDPPSSSGNLFGSGGPSGGSSLFGGNSGGSENAFAFGGAGKPVSSPIFASGNIFAAGGSNPFATGTAEAPVTSGGSSIFCGGGAEGSSSLFGAGSGGGENIFAFGGAGNTGSSGTGGNPNKKKRRAE